MLTALIVKLYKWLVELMLWVFIVAGGIAASRMEQFVDIPLNEDWFVDKQVVGFISGALAAFFVAAIVFGAVLILIEIQRSLRLIETQLERRALIQKEPTLIPSPSPVGSSAESIQLQEQPDLVPQRMAASSSAEDMQLQEEPDLVPQRMAASSSAEKVQQRVSKARQKRKLDGVPGNRPIQGSDKTGPDE